MPCPCVLIIAMIDAKSRTALTIAGSDPTGGAGFQSDLRTFSSMGVYGLSIAAVLTAQNTGGVHAIQEVPSDFVLSQMNVLLQDISPDAVKTGMLYSKDIVSIIAGGIRKYSLKNVVIDPVTVSSTGVMLMEEKGLDVVKGDLFPLAKVITPNIYEAGLLAGMEVVDEEDMKEAALILKECGPAAVIITGGHLEDRAMDLLYDGEEFLSLENERLPGEYHGTGCVFSASMTACLARGYDIKEAFIKAKDFTYTAMKNALSAGKGMRLMNV